MRKIAVPLCLALAAPSVWAGVQAPWIHPLVLVTSDRQPSYRHFTRDFETDLAHRGLPPAQILVVHGAKSLAQGGPGWTALEAARLVIVMGPGNLIRVLTGNHPTPVLCLYVTRHDFHHLARHVSTTQPPTAIYLNQPLTRIFALARALIPHLHVVSTVLSTDQGWRKPRIRHLARTLGYVAHILVVPDRLHAIFSAFRFVLPGTNVLIEFPDATVFNAATLPIILMRTIRYGVPIISYAPAYVQTGAVAALYSTPAQLARQTLHLVTALGGLHGKLPPPAYPTHFKLLLNPAVAKVLGIHLPPASVIRSRMRDPSVSWPAAPHT